MLSNTTTGATDANLPRRFLRIGEVRQRTGLPVSTVYYLMAKKKFPSSFKLSERVAAWDEAEVLAWQAERIAERDRAAA